MLPVGFSRGHRFTESWTSVRARCDALILCLLFLQLAGMTLMGDFEEGEGIKTCFVFTDFYRYFPVFFLLFLSFSSRAAF